MNKLFFVALLCITSITQCTQKSQMKSAVITANVMIDPVPTSYESHNLVVQDTRDQFPVGVTPKVMIEVKIENVNIDGDDAALQTVGKRVAAITLLPFERFFDKSNGDKIIISVPGDDTQQSTMVELTCCANPRLNESFETSVAECVKGYKRSQRVCNRIRRSYEIMPADLKYEFKLALGIFVFVVMKQLTEMYKQGTSGQ